MKKEHKDLFKFLFFFLGILAITTNLFYYSYLFGIAYHNMDLAQNIRYLEAKYDLDLVDKMTNDYYASSTDLWSIGYNQFKKSVIGLLFTGIIIGLYFAMIFYQNFSIKNKKLYKGTK